MTWWQHIPSGAIAIVWLFLALLSPANGSEYEVQGHLLKETYEVNPAANKTNRYAFKIFVRGQSCLVQLVANTEFTPAKIYYESGWQEGTNISYRVYRFQKPEHTIGYVLTNFLPIAGAGMPESYLWMMLASAGYLRSHHREKSLAPVYDPGTREDPTALQKADWDLLPGWPGLPERIILWNEGYYRWRTREGVPQQLGLPPPFHQGFTNAIFHVTGRTNLGENIFPTGFTFEWYRPVPSPLAKKTDLIVRERVVVNILSISLKCSLPKLIPPLRGRTIVYDDRIPSTNPAKARQAVYRLYSGKWLSLAEARKLYQRQSSRNTTSLPLTMAFFLLAAMAPFILVLLQTKKS